MLCAHLAGNTAAKNFWIVLMVVEHGARTCVLQRVRARINQSGRRGTQTNSPEVES
jgi:hypothetical protein